MIFLDFIVGLEDLYYNSDAVIVAFFFLIFVLIYFVLLKSKAFKPHQKGIVVVIALVISLFFVFSAKDKLGFWFQSFNFFLWGAIIVVALVLFRAFYRFFRGQY